MQHIFHMMERRTLGAAYFFYCQKELLDAHSAESDAHATWEILLAQIERYPNIGTTIEHIVKFTGEDEIGVALYSILRWWFLVSKGCIRL